LHKFILLLAHPICLCLAMRYTWTNDVACGSSEA